MSVVCFNFAKNIGAVLDTTMNLDNHIAQVCKSASFSIRNIARVRKFLSHDVMMMMMMM